MIIVFVNLFETHDTWSHRFSSFKDPDGKTFEIKNFCRDYHLLITTATPGGRENQVRIEKSLENIDRKVNEFDAAGLIVNLSTSCHDDLERHVKDLVAIRTLKAAFLHGSDANPLMNDRVRPMFRETRHPVKIYSTAIGHDGRPNPVWSEIQQQLNLGGKITFSEMLHDLCKLLIIPRMALIVSDDSKGVLDHVQNVMQVDLEQWEKEVNQELGSIQETSLYKDLRQQYKEENENDKGNLYLIHRHAQQLIGRFKDFLDPDPGRGNQADDVKSLKNGFDSLFNQLSSDNEGE